MSPTRVRRCIALDGGQSDHDDERSARRQWTRAFLVAALAAMLPVDLPAAGAAKEPFSEGRLWRVSRVGVADSFVFGTIHLADPRISRLPSPVEEALARSRTLATELVPEAAESALLEFEQLDGGRRLEPLLGSAAFAQLRGELAMQGIPVPVIERLKPWAAMLKITRVSGSSDDASLDTQLASAARARGMRRMSLELVDEQVAAFDAVPLESQVAMLKHALDQRDALAATVEATIDAWLRGDLAALAKLPERIGRQFPGMAPHYRAFATHVIDGRTVLMHHRLFMPLREGRVFAAIGAAHLYGRNGLLAMLQKDGYRVTKIW